MKLFSSVLAVVSANKFSEIIKEVNEAKAGWVAGENFHEEINETHIKQWLGALD